MKRNYMIATGVIAALASVASAADHKEAPLITEDPTADIADVFAFNSPENNGNVVLAMTVNGFSAPTEGTAYRFSPNVRYRFEVDLDNNGVSDRTITVSFDGEGNYTVQGPGIGKLAGVETLPTLASEANDPVVNTDMFTGVRSFAGPRDDPFFFDFVGFNRFLGGGAFTGNDSFAGFNVSAIVIEAPLSIISGGSSSFQVWGATDRRKITLRRGSRGQLERELGPWEQVERMGNPAVNTALIPGDLKDFYNIGTPDNDAGDFAGAIVASLQSLGTNDENIGILASVAVPDTLKVDATNPTNFPNGRSPGDDVVDGLLFFIFNQPADPSTASDTVQKNDMPPNGAFPYLPSPHQPE